MRITVPYELKENMWGCDKAFHALRCVSLHLNLRACFCSRDLFYSSVTSRQCALISSHCSDVICVGWALLNDLSYWILGILKLLKSFCWPLNVVYTLFTGNYARNNILRGRKKSPVRPDRRNMYHVGVTFVF